MASASFRTSARVPTLAPASVNSASVMDAGRPAPVSTATVAPRPRNRLMDSGVAATRLSATAPSLRTANFTRSAADQKNYQQGGNEADDGTPLKHPRKQ